MKWLRIILVLVVLAAGAGVFYVRTVKHDPAGWHVDPATVTEVQQSNQYLGEAKIDAPLRDVTIALDLILRGKGGVFNSKNERIAGDLESGFATYVVRTPLIGFPDYISARVTEEGRGTKVVIFSRSRFGQSDLGANKDRVESIFSSLEITLTKP